MGKRKIFSSTGSIFVPAIPLPKIHFTLLYRSHFWKVVIDRLPFPRHGIHVKNPDTFLKQHVLLLKLHKQLCFTITITIMLELLINLSSPSSLQGRHQYFIMLGTYQVLNKYLLNEFHVTFEGSFIKKCFPCTKAS